MGVEISIRNTPPGIQHWSVGIAQVDSGYNYNFDWLTTVPIEQSAKCGYTPTAGSYLTLIRLWENVAGYPAAEYFFTPHEHPVEDGKSYVIDWETGTVTEHGEGNGEGEIPVAGMGWGWLGLGVLALVLVSSINTKNRGV